MQYSNTVHQRFFEKLQKLYISSMPDKHGEITTFWVLAEQQQWQGEAVEKLRYIMHRLIGSGASYGFNDISAAARQVQLLLQPPITEEHLPEIQRGLQSICSLLTIYAHEEHHLQNTEALGLSPHPQTPMVILWVDSPEESANAIIKYLINEGYEVHFFTNLDDFATKIPQLKPAVVLFDSPSKQQYHAELRQFGQLWYQYYPDVPCIFMSHQHDAKTRLLAIQAGARAFLPKPLSIASLQSSLNNVLVSTPIDPYRLLLVEVDQDLANLYQMAFIQAGIQTLLLSNVIQLHESLVNFKPDLIILDVQMGEFSGYDIAQFIRQNIAYLPIPLLFMGTDNSADTQMQAMQAGGDVYLTKPIALDILVRITLARLAQARRIKSRLAYDGLTNILERDFFILQLSGLLATAERSGSQVGVAIIDIKDFKHVNEEYGYWMGDNLLKHVAKTLKQRLRRGDLLGRYQLDQFIITLSDADSGSAEKVVEGLIKDITHTPFQMGENTCYFTLNAGIAHYPGHLYTTGKISTDIISTAEQALQDAKQQGNNHIEMRSIGNIM